MFYTRMKIGETLPGRVFDALPKDHPLTSMQCEACSLPFHEGDRTAFVPLGPGLDATEQSKAMNGMYFQAVAIPVHAACAGLTEDNPVPLPDERPLEFKGAPTSQGKGEPVRYLVAQEGNEWHIHDLQSTGASIYKSTDKIEAIREAQRRNGFEITDGDEATWTSQTGASVQQATEAVH